MHISPVAVSAEGLATARQLIKLFETIERCSHAPDAGQDRLKEAIWLFRAGTNQAIANQSHASAQPALTLVQRETHNG